MDGPQGPIPEILTFDAAKKPLMPGQLYALDPKLAGWGPKSRYYNPPIVLVISCPDEHSVFVCQTYGDTTFAGPDDVDLETGLCGFAEPWNCYTLMRSDLAFFSGTVAMQVIEIVQQQSTQSRFTPQPGSLLWFFRQMEVETGYFFSHRAVTRLLALHENDNLVRLANTDSNKIMQDLERLPLRLATLDFPPASPLDLLCWAEPDPQRLPLAAADTESLPALVFTLKEGSLTAIEVLQMKISFSEYAVGLMTITGSVPSLPAGSYSWIFRWHAENQLIEPLPDHSGHDGLHFWTAFSLKPEQAMPPGHLAVRLLREERG